MERAVLPLIWITPAILLFWILCALLLEVVSPSAYLLNTMASALEAIANSDGGDGKSKNDLYLQFLNEAAASGNYQSCSQFVDHGKIAIYCYLSLYFIKLIRFILRRSTTLHHLLLNNLFVQCYPKQSL